jgi:hypothetical protein
MLAVLIGGWGCSTPAQARPRAMVVEYHGARVVVPASWPVFDLRSAPTTCVRFNRHAVYLGTPASAQRCPAHSVGRTEAVLLSLVNAVRARSAQRSPGARANGVAAALAGSASKVTVQRQHGVIITATWGSEPSVIKRALGVHTLGAVGAHVASASRRKPVVKAHAASVFTGLGIDVCATPSGAALSAWSSSPYRGVGAYLGGANMACSQPNFTAAWVSSETAAGWHIIPTYVGLQAPGNSCGCASITPSKAAAQGTAAADDAITRAETVAIGPGNPIYFDMEAYSRTGSATAAVRSFLASWTATLHNARYLSGVYSSGLSGIADLAAVYGTGYLEPDDIWIADWNGRQTTSDPYVPAGDWPLHQRLHQYLGGHNVTFGGVTLDIDSNAIDGATVGSGGQFADGTFVSINGDPAIYRIAGGAPLLVSNWDAFGGTQPVIEISQAQFDSLNPVPANGTFLITNTGNIFRVAGGAPLTVSTWSPFGGPQPAVTIDQWDIDNITDPAAHLRTAPADGSVVEGLPSGSYWLFGGGVRALTTASPTATAVDDVGLAPFLQIASVPIPAVKAPQCIVPRLLHKTVSQATRALRQAHCLLGKVHRPRHVARRHVLRVVAQSPASGAKRAVSFKVAVTVR